MTLHHKGNHGKMAESTSTTRATKAKTATVSVRSGRGGRGVRGGGRRAAPPRVVMDWDAEEDDDGGDGKKKRKKKERKTTTESEEEREIDAVVERAEMETFAGTMVIDADDMAERDTLLGPTKPKKKKKKPAKKEEAKENAVVNEQKSEETKAPTTTTPKKKKKDKVKKTRVTVVVTEEEAFEVVQLENEAGVTTDGTQVQISVKKNTKKQKNKNKKAEGKQVAQEQVVVVDEETKTATPKAPKKKKDKQKKEQAVQDAVVVEEVKVEKITKKKEKTKKGTVKSTVVETVVMTKTVEPTGKHKKKGPAKANENKAEVKVDAAPPRVDFYENYQARAEVMTALERGELYQGKLRINPQYRMRAFLTVEGIPVDILIDGVKDRNRAMDGDLVAITLLPEDEWKPLNDAKKDQDDEDEKQRARKASSQKKSDVDAGALNALWRPTLDSARCFLPSSKTETKEKSQSTDILTRAHTVYERSLVLKKRPTAKVVFILATGNAQGFVGSLEPKTRVPDDETPLDPNDDYAFFNAHDARMPRRIRIPRLQLPDEFVQHPLKYSRDMLCFVRITKWSVRHEAPMGEFVKTLGEYSGIESGISAILTKHGLLQHTLDFRREILDELDAIYGTSGEKWQVPEEELSKRRDFRQHQIFSIDPYNARDLDDALHITALDKDETKFEVGVHIADVTHFMPKSSLLDNEAQQRATSVYLANRVLPMLPRVLCERLCSLQPQVDRLAFSVVWQMNADGSLVEGCTPWFGKSIIRSCCKLDYGTAQRMLDGEVTKDKLEEWEEARRPIPGDNPAITPATVIKSVKYLWLVAQNRRKTRFETGAVTLQDVKLVFTLDAKGNPTTFGTYQLKNSNRLVEEYMLLANYLVAQRLLQAHGPLAFIRRHPEPNERALDTTISLLSEHRIEIDGSSPKTLTDSLDSVRTSLGQLAYGVVQNMITKPMKPAEYLVAGNAGTEAAWCHYALNIPYYTHFTSPIRRYADVVVHRLLQESLESADEVASRLEDAGAELTTLMHELHSVAQNCNEKKMTSKNAEKEADQVFLCAYVKHHGAVEVTGVIVSCGQRSLTVYINEIGLEQRLELRSLGVSGSWNETTSTLTISIGSSGKKKKNKKGKPQGQVEEAETEEKTEETKQEETPAKKEKSARVELKFMSKLRLLMSTTDKMPMALKFTILGELK